METSGVVFRWLKLWTICVNVLLFLSIKNRNLSSPITTVSMKHIACTAFDDSVVTPVENYKQHGTVIKYDRNELLHIRDQMKSKVIYKTLHPLAVTKIRKYRIFKRLCRGGRNKRTLMSENRSENRQACLENLIPVRCEKTDHIYRPHHHKMTMSTANIQSITSRNKDLALIDILLESNLDICTLTETWLNNSDNNRTWIESCELNKHGYKLDVCNREDRPGGGIGLVFRDNLKVKLIQKGALRSFEFGKWSITSKSCMCTVICVYHPPYSATNRVTDAMFLDDFISWCANCITTDTNVVITGDFNMHVNDPSDPEAASLIDSMEALGLIQHVNIPTHRYGNTLDLVFTESTEHINISNIVPGEFLSDHCLVMWQTSITRADLISKTITTRKMKEIDTEK